MTLGAPLLRGVIGALFVGHGTPSVDGDRLHGRFWALASLGAGIAGSYLATSPPVNEEPPAREATGRFTREKEPVPAQ